MYPDLKQLQQNLIAMKLYLFCLSYLFIFSSYHIEAQNVESVFPLKWKTEIGLTTFRTNIVFDEASSNVIVGSNGNLRALSVDKKDGVYLIDASSGSVKTMIHMSGMIDGDVNGVAVSNGYIWFGNDNSDFFCYDTFGNIKWSVNMLQLFDATDGDMEGCPALLNINNDAVPDVVFTIESCGLAALDGATGSVLWSYLSPSSQGYMNSPAIYDVNDDGKEDVIFGAKNDPNAWYGDRAVALNGTDGELIWEYPLGSAVHASTIVLERHNETEILVTECYSTVNFFDKYGSLIKMSSQSVPNGGISGLFSSPVINENELMVLGTSWWGEDDGVWVIDISNKALLPPDMEYETYNDAAKNFTQCGLVSSSAVIADLLNKPKGKEIAICTEKGQLIIFDQYGKIIKKLNLPAGVEASPLIKDIDHDGKSEILIACLDGWLYCFETDCKENILWGQFRGDNKNKGVLSLNN